MATSDDGCGCIVAALLLILGIAIVVDSLPNPPSYTEYEFVKMGLKVYTPSGDIIWKPEVQEIIDKHAEKVEKE
jgi:hypothetical protein